MDDAEPSKIVFSEDGKTVTMSVEKFNFISILAAKNWQAEVNIIHAYMIFNETLFHEDDVEQAKEEFTHGVRQFIHDMTVISHDINNRKG